jgi:hypothetical protein
VQLRVCLSDLLSATWAVLVGIASAVFTIAAVVTAILGGRVATPWLVVGALACVLVIVFTAYVRAAKARDEHVSATVTERRLFELESRPHIEIDTDGVPYVAGADGKKIGAMNDDRDELLARIAELEARPGGYDGGTL